MKSTPTAGPRSICASSRLQTPGSRNIRACPCCSAWAISPRIPIRKPCRDSRHRLSSRAELDRSEVSSNPVISITAVVQPRVSTSKKICSLQGFGYADEDCRRARHRIFLHMTGCRAPGLEQGNDNPALAKPVLRRSVWLWRDLGFAQAVRDVALGTLTKTKSRTIRLIPTPVLWRAPSTCSRPKSWFCHPSQSHPATGARTLR